MSHGKCLLITVDTIDDGFEFSIMVRHYSQSQSPLVCYATIKCSIGNVAQTLQDIKDITVSMAFTLDGNHDFNRHTCKDLVIKKFPDCCVCPDALK